MRRFSDSGKGLNGLVETSLSGFNIDEGALWFGQIVDELCELDLDECNIELKINFLGTSIKSL